MSKKSKKLIRLKDNDHFDDILKAILRLSDDIGKMADRIGDMADKIGDMADRIKDSEKMLLQLMLGMLATIEKTQSNMLHLMPLLALLVKLQPTYLQVN